MMSIDFQNLLYFVERTADCLLLFGLLSFAVPEFVEFDLQVLCAFGDSHFRRGMEFLDGGS
jgi:hypothetical protein